MSRIFLTGDTHIPIDISKLGASKFKDGKVLTKDDYVIVLGDFGLLWKLQPDKTEIHWTEWLNEKPWTTLFVDGNHENFERVNELPEEDMLGGKVGKVSDSIYHLKRGEIFTINDKKFFVMGGAKSIDKEWRTNHLSWWAGEEHSHQDIDNALNNLEKNDYRVDYILTHTAPYKCVQFILDHQRYGVFDLAPDKVNDPVVRFLDTIDAKTDFSKWYFGHMHTNMEMYEKYQCLYGDIVEL